MMINKKKIKESIKDLVDLIKHPDNCQCIYCCDSNIFYNDEMLTKVLDPEKLEKSNEIQNSLLVSNNPNEVIKPVKNSLINRFNNELSITHLLDKILIYLNGFGILFFMLKSIFDCIFKDYISSLVSLVSLIVFVLINIFIFKIDNKGNIK